MRLRGGEGKWLMKRAMAGHLPNAIYDRPKMGFVTPIARWFRTGLAADAEALVRSPRLLDTGWFDAAMLSDAVAQHRSGKADNSRLIWQLLMLDKSLARLFG